jgi:hypothetical protein
MTSQLHDHSTVLPSVTKATEALESKLVLPDSFHRVESPLSLMDSSPKSESASIAAVAALPPGGKMLRRVSRDNDIDSTGRSDSFNSKKSEQLDSLERCDAVPACNNECTLASIDSTEAKSLAGMETVKKRDEQHSPLEEPTAKKAKTIASKVVEVNRIQFSDIRAILEHGGYRSEDESYRRPCGMTFESPESLRNDLCAYGVSCQCDNSSAAQHEYNACTCWDKDQKSLIRSWVRLNVIRGPIALGKANQMPATKFLPLAKRLGCGPFCSRLCDGYKLPCVENPAVNGVLGLTTFRTSLDLMSFLSRFGFPEESFFDKLGDKELFDLEAFLATYKRGTLYVLKRTRFEHSSYLLRRRLHTPCFFPSST